MARRRLPKKGPLTWLVVFIGLLVALVHLAQDAGWFTGSVQRNDQAVELVKVRDGDTVEVRHAGKQMAVRLRCVDTPESVHPDESRNTPDGARISAWAKAYLVQKTIRIEFEHDHEHIALDQYGRALGYLWIDHSPPGPGPEDELFNETLIRQGFSVYFTKFGASDTHHRRFLAAEAEAKRENRGIWRH